MWTEQLARADCNLLFSNCQSCRFRLRFKAWFSYVEKTPDDRRFYCFQTVPGFSDQWKLKRVDISIVWDGRGQIWRIVSVSIFPTFLRFLRWSVIIPDQWKLKFGPSRTSAMDFAHYLFPKLLVSSSPGKNEHVSIKSKYDVYGYKKIYFPVSYNAFSGLIQIYQKKYFLSDKGNSENCVELTIFPNILWSKTSSVFLIMAIFALTSKRTQMHWERRSLG